MLWVEGNNFRFCLGSGFLPRGKEETEGNGILTLLSSPLINWLKDVDV